MSKRQKLCEEDKTGSLKKKNYSQRDIEQQIVIEKEPGAVLDQLPETAKHIHKGLKAFSKNMQCCFTDLTDDQMSVYPSFKLLRDSTVADALTYFSYVMPICQEITANAASFFQDFPDMYEDNETFVENIDMVLSDVEDFRQGFLLCKELHKKVAEKGNERQIQCERLASEIGEKNIQFKQQLKEAEAEQKELAKKVQEEKDFNKNSFWNYIPIASEIHSANMNKQIREATRDANRKAQEAETLNRTTEALFAVVHSIKDCMVPALIAYIAAIQNMAHIFGALADDTKSITDKREKVIKLNNPRKAKLLYSCIIKNAKNLHKHLRSVIQVFDEVDSDFKAMKSFSNIEAKFTASLVFVLQKEITKGKDAVKGNKDRIEQLSGWCEKIDSIKITQVQIAAETNVQKPLNIKRIGEVEEPKLDVVKEILNFTKIMFKK